MTPESLIHTAIEPALALLPQMDRRAAKIMLAAIALQESGIKHRRQVGGPARGYWQFEQGGGVRGVLNHPASSPHIRRVLKELDYSSESSLADCYAAIEHNDILAAAFARLLLWTDPAPLPDDADGAWNLYLRTWRPGRPHPGRWPANYAKAQEAVAKCG